VRSGWFDSSASANVVCLELDQPAAWITEYYPTRSVEALPDGGVMVALPVGDPGWLTGLLLRLGPHVRRVDPPEAAADALAEAREVLAGSD